MTILEIVGEIADLFWSWRVCLWVSPAILLACFLHSQWPEARWLWFLTVPGVVGALA